jgi:hypothetical protein
MDYPGTPLSVTSTATVLDATVGMVAKVVLFPAPGNSNPIYIGNSSLDVLASPPTSVLAIVPAPVAGQPLPEVVIDQERAAHSVHTNLLYAAGTTNDVLYWRYTMG